MVCGSTYINLVRCAATSPFICFIRLCLNGFDQSCNVSLIALLRDPVERTLSQYFHARRRGYEQLDLVSALAAEEKRMSGANAVVSS